TREAPASTSAIDAIGRDQLERTAHVHLHADLDGLAAHLTVLHAGLRASRKVEADQDHFAAVRTGNFREGFQRITAGFFAGLEDRLEAVEPVDVGGPAHAGDYRPEGRAACKPALARWSSRRVAGGTRRQYPGPEQDC